MPDQHSASLSEESLTRQGMQNIQGLQRERLAKRGNTQCYNRLCLVVTNFHSQWVHITVKKNMHLILHGRQQEYLP